jgi:hypothetical protein
MPSYNRGFRGGLLCWGMVVGIVVTDGSDSLYDMRARAYETFSVAGYLYLFSIAKVQRS